MVRTIGRLKALDVMRATAPGLYPDGGGLYLQVGGRERPKKPGTSPASIMKLSQMSPEILDMSK